MRGAFTNPNASPAVGSHPSQTPMKRKSRKNMNTSIFANAPGAPKSR